MTANPPLLSLGLCFWLSAGTFSLPAAAAPALSTTAPGGFLHDNRAGYWLADAGDVTVWWCESGWKIGRDRVPPSAAADGAIKPVSLSAAGGEYEAAQIILRPKKEAELISVKVSPLRRSTSADTLPPARVDEVAYVQVVRPTDASCAPGSYPDPLPPLSLPLRLRARQNQPLWLTFHVPPQSKAGEYRGSIELQTTAGTVDVPLVVRVFGFTLPEETHLHSALGLGVEDIARYHHVTGAEERQQVFEQYLQNFAEHRISPYSFYDLAPIRLKFAGEGTNKHPQLDFAQFDRAAARWLDAAHFSTFQLPLQGMGSGTFDSRHLGQLEGFTEGTPEHARLFNEYLGTVEKHLAERGWLARAFTYWFDEPDPKDYDFVVAGMERLKAAAPGIRRMLTEQPEPKLIGHVDIWCGLTPQWNPENVRARRDAGEEVWWYICTGPKAPYVTEFIDHPGTELRLWPWQSWQYGVSGILVWATVYWNSPLVFRAPQLQNPWTDPMSYVSGYSFKPGHLDYWGNGDGRFLYPPQRDATTASDPCLDKPINSIRWENLRDGMEDYEYLWLLDQAVKRRIATHGQQALISEARALLTVPEAVSTDLTHFTTDPRTLLEHRQRVAEMLEAWNAR